MQSPPFPRYLVPLRSKYSPQHHVLKYPEPPFLPQYNTLKVNVTHIPRNLVTGNVTRKVEMFWSVRYTWVLLIISIRRGTANTGGIRVVPSHVIQHDIYIYSETIIRTLRPNITRSTTKNVTAIRYIIK